MSSLYWFLQMRHAEEFMKTGKMYFGNSSGYDDVRLTAAQRDRESLRSARFSRTEIRIKTGPNAAEAVEVPLTSVEFTSKLPSYFLRCFSSQLRESMMAEFKCDAVIEFFDQLKLVHAIEDAVSKQHGTGAWRLARKHVRYVSKHELIGINDIVERIFAKDRSTYGTQAEYRFVLIPEHNFPGKNDPHLFVYLENVSEFGRLLKDPAPSP